MNEYVELFEEKVIAKIQMEIKAYAEVQKREGHGKQEM
jgi:hypothetical protein